MKLHTILGAGGTVSDQLLPVLVAGGEKIRLVSRRERRLAGVETMVANITHPQQTLEAVKGSAVVYLLAGLPYRTHVWAEQWPRIITNVINACVQTGSKLIFFDNVYMYGKVEGPMREDTPFNPISKKGTIRAAVATQLLSEMKAGNIEALIARSADFYGPVGYTTTVPNILVFANLAANKKAQWLVNARVPHSLTYVPDAARALYVLSRQPSAFGQTWHLPTASLPPTGEEFIKAAAAAMGTSDRYMVISKTMMRLGGLFNGDIRESVEMVYQNEYPYLFDSSKFNTAFGFTPLSYEEGITRTAAWASAVK